MDLPQRMDNKDPAFHQWMGKLHVYLDGEYQEHCFAYDVAQGWVKNYIYADGAPLLNVKTQSIASEVLGGHVRVQHALPWPHVDWGDIDHAVSKVLREEVRYLEQGIRNDFDTAHRRMKKHREERPAIEWGARPSKPWGERITSAAEAFGFALRHFGASLETTAKAFRSMKEQIDVNTRTKGRRSPHDR